MPFLKKTPIIAAAIAILAASCAKQSGGLRDGDLLFQVNEPTGFVKAIVDATSMPDSIDFSHVGVFAVIDGDSMVIEASPSQGVVATPLRKFISEGCSSEGMPAVVAARVKDPIDVGRAVERAKARLGENYDWEFAAGNDCVYCSELVQEAYLYDDGLPVFESVPMNFADADGAMPQFWVDLFEGLGKPIPQGMPGTNPNSLFYSGHLAIVKKF